MTYQEAFRKWGSKPFLMACTAYTTKMGSAALTAECVLIAEDEIVYTMSDQPLTSFGPVKIDRYLDMGSALLDWFDDEAPGVGRKVCDWQGPWPVLAKGKITQELFLISDTDLVIDSTVGSFVGDKAYSRQTPNGVQATYYVVDWWFDEPCSLSNEQSTTANSTTCTCPSLISGHWAGCTYKRAG